MKEKKPKIFIVLPAEDIGKKLFKVKKDAKSLKQPTKKTQHPKKKK
jgi:hypothetical protein